MPRRSRMAVLKRQREIRKAEKAASKRAKRQGRREERPTEPQPTVRLSDPVGQPDSSDESEETDSGRAADKSPSKEEQG